MKGQRGREMRRRHSSVSPRFNEIRGLYSRYTHAMRPAGDSNADESLRDAIAGDRRGTAAHKGTSRKGGR